MFGSYAFGVPYFGQAPDDVLIVAFGSITTTTLAGAGQARTLAGGTTRTLAGGVTRTLSGTRTRRTLGTGTTYTLGTTE